MDGRQFISSLVGGQMNGVMSFFIAPDGSKEGWGTSTEGDQARQQFISWVRAHTEWVDWVLVEFGQDSYDIRVVEHNNSYMED